MKNTDKACSHEDFPNKPYFDLSDSISLSPLNCHSIALLAVTLT